VRNYWRIGAQVRELHWARVLPFISATYKQKESQPWLLPCNRRPRWKFTLPSDFALTDLAPNEQTLCFPCFAQVACLSQKKLQKLLLTQHMKQTSGYDLLNLATNAIQNPTPCCSMQCRQHLIPQQLVATWQMLAPLSYRQVCRADFNHLSDRLMKLQHEVMFVVFVLV
jgi:hypothetical protein